MKTRKDKILLLVYILIFSIVLSIFIFSDYGVLRFLGLKKEISELENNIKKSEMQIEKYNKEIDSLKNNNAKIEKVAREKYYMHKSNEKVIKVEVK